jgi:hypothetical protein
MPDSRTHRGAIVGVDATGWSGTVDAEVQARPFDRGGGDHRHPDAPGHSAGGIEAAVELRRTAPEVGLLLLSQHVETH